MGRETIQWEGRVVGHKELAGDFLLKGGRDMGTFVLNTKNGTDELTLGQSFYS